MSPISIILIIIAIAFLIIAYRILVLDDKSSHKKLIFGARERLENKRYNIADIENADPSIFFDDSQLLLTSHSDPIALSKNAARNDSFFTNLGIQHIDSIQTDDAYVGLLMPFNNKFQNRYNTIKEVCEKYGFKCHRSDETYQVGNLLKQIVELILKSQLIIAIIDGKNPNVFYEIGLAHALGKPVIIIANMVEEDSIPFNISSERLLLYSNLTDLAKKLSRIFKTLRNA